MSKFMITPITLAVHPVNENPVFDEGVTHITLSDDAGGCYVSIKQLDPYLEQGEVRFDFDEFELIMKAVETLRAAAKEIEATKTA